MPERKPVDARFIRESSVARTGRAIGETDAAAVANLLGGLESDMQAFRRLPVADVEEPATTYSPIEDES